MPNNYASRKVKRFGAFLLICIRLQWVAALFQRFKIFFQITQPYKVFWRLVNILSRYRNCFSSGFSPIVYVL